MLPNLARNPRALCEESIVIGVRKGHDIQFESCVDTLFGLIVLFAVFAWYVWPLSGMP